VHGAGALVRDTCTSAGVGCVGCPCWQCREPVCRLGWGPQIGPIWTTHRPPPPATRCTVQLAAHSSHTPPPPIWLSLSIALIAHSSELRAFALVARSSQQPAAHAQFGRATRATCSTRSTQHAARSCGMSFAICTMEVVHALSVLTHNLVYFHRLVHALSMLSLLPSTGACAIYA
jgi:hypothetical protein